MNINDSINLFYKLLEIAQNIKLITTDLYVVAVKELNVNLMKIDYSKDAFNNMNDSLALLKNRGIIYDYKKMEYGFIIYPQNKIYINENELIVKFNIDNLIKNIDR